jgi:hypothetical protein
MSYKGELMKQTVTFQDTKRRTDYIQVKSLMERIILQSMEDLWVPGEKDDCMDFFRGEGFAICAAIAGLKTYDKAGLIDLVNRIFSFQAAKGRKRKNAEMKKEILTSGSSSLWNMNLSTTAKQKIHLRHV